MLDEFIVTLQKLGLKPKDLSLYFLAFTHGSYLNETNEKIESNERLEFLGDAVLEFIISSYLFTKRPYDCEGELTNLRSYIVKTSSLARASKSLNLGKFLRLSKGEELSGGRENSQLLANTYEAILGAIYKDLNILGTIKFISQTLLPLFTKEVEKGPPKDAKSLLQEIIQTKNKTAPKYKVIETFGPDHAKRFIVGVFLGGEEIGRGEGSNKQSAEEQAAKKALDKLTNQR